MRRGTDYYRALRTDGLLQLAREEGIDPEMAVAMAERLDILENAGWRLRMSHESMGGRYTFKQRSEA